jgi:hypothetical protein
MPEAAVRSRAPERTCIGCRRKASPAGLVRVARHPDGSLGVGRREPGRGAWLCAGSVSCFDAALRRRAFGRALRCDPPGHELEQLRGRLLSEGVSAPHGPSGRSSEGVVGA